MNTSSPEIYLVDGLRTAVGSPYKGLKAFTSAQLAAKVIAEIVRRNKVRKQLVSEVFFGNTVSAGAGQNVARQAVYLADLPVTVPAYTVNNVCGSGLQTVIMAAQSIVAEPGRLVVAGGTESVTHAPHLIPKGGDKAMSSRTPIESLIYDGLWCLLTGKHMGELCEDLAQEHKISRREQDQYAVNSHRKACAAQRTGKFKREIVALKAGAQEWCEQDERPKRDVSVERLERFSPAFRENGTITAGNASIPCDGACAVLLASRETVKAQGLRPLARLLGYASIAVDPAKAFTASIVAVQSCLKRCQLTMADVDLFEICESFSAQAIFTRQQLNIPEEKMNIFGGDVAIGHPLGSTGTRILVTLAHALHDRKKQRGVAAVCLGGGGAVAVAVEAV